MQHEGAPAKDMPADERPYSEQFRIIGKRWVELDGAARLLEECKTAVLAKRKKDMGDIPDSHAEKEVKASDDWFKYLNELVEARTKANLLRIQLEYIRMKDREQSSKEANARHEYRLTR